MSDQKIDKPSPSRVKELLINIFVLVVTVLIFLTIVELAVRHYYPQYIKVSQFDPDIATIRIPNTTFDFIRKSDNVRVTHTVNGDGFIGSSYVIPKPANTFRIVVVGDSYTEAIQVADNERNTVLLEKRLNTLGARKFEVINLGYSGFGTAQEYLTLKKFGLKYQPDLVILNFFGDNDIVDNSQKLGFSPVSPYFEVQNGNLVQVVKARSVVTNPFLKFITDHTALPRFIYERIVRIEHETANPAFSSYGTNETVYDATYTPAWNDAWDVTKKLIIAINDEAVTHGAKFAVVSIPAPVQVVPSVTQEWIAQLPTRRTSDLDKPDRIVSQLGAEQHIPVLTLRQDFMNLPNNSSFYLPDDGHFTPLGNDVEADAVFRFLLAQHLVPE